MRRCLRDFCFLLYKISSDTEKCPLKAKRYEKSDDENKLSTFRGLFWCSLICRFVNHRKKSPISRNQVITSKLSCWYGTLTMWIKLVMFVWHCVVRTIYSSAWHVVVLTRVDDSSNSTQWVCAFVLPFFSVLVVVAAVDIETHFHVQLPLNSIFLFSTFFRTFRAYVVYSIVSNGANGLISVLIIWFHSTASSQTPFISRWHWFARFDRKNILHYFLAFDISLFIFFPCAKKKHRRLRFFPLLTGVVNRSYRWLCVILSAVA